MGSRTSLAARGEGHIYYRDVPHFDPDAPLLAEMQTHALVAEPDSPNGATQLNAALAFKGILVLIYRGSRLRNELLTAMSGLALQWLRIDAPPSTSWSRKIKEA